MERQESSGVKKIDNDRMSLRIRAHHLPFVPYAVAGPPLNELVENIIRGINLGDIYRAGDMLGGTKNQEDRFREYATDFFSRLSQLSPDHPVEIVIGELDRICQGCAHGEHCKRRENLDLDRKFATAFVEKAVQLGLSKKISIEKYEVQSGTEAVTVNKVLTTARTVIVITQNDEFAKFMKVTNH